MDSSHEGFNPGSSEVEEISEEDFEEESEEFSEEESEEFSEEEFEEVSEEESEKVSEDTVEDDSEELSEEIVVSSEPLQVYSPQLDALVWIGIIGIVLVFITWIYRAFNRLFPDF